MSRDSSDCDGLTDWALVSQEGNIEGDEASSGSSSEEFVNVTRDGVVFNRHRSPSLEASSVEESLASSEMSALLQSSLDELDNDEATEDAQDTPEGELDAQDHLSLSVPGAETGPSLDGSMVSTGDESTDILTEDEAESQHLGTPLAVGLPPNIINISSTLSSLSLVSGLPVSSDGADNGAEDGPEPSDDGVVSLSTNSMTGSRSESEEICASQNPDGEVNTSSHDEQQLDGLQECSIDQCQTDADTADPRASESQDIIEAKSVVNTDEVATEDKTEVRGGSEAGESEGAENLQGACGEGSQWLKYPIESSADQCHIRLGDGRVIVAPPGADLESLAASFSLANKSETSSDTGSDSDFVRLEAISSCSSSNENSDTEGEEVSREELPAPVEDNEDVAAVEDVMAESVSSVSSRFRFLPQLNVVAIEAPQVAPVVHVAEQEVPDDNDGDTESVSGHGEDDRIESDQSEASAEELAEEEDRALNDIADIPLVAGDRQYIHQCNKHLNWTLDVVVIMVILLTIGIAIGHSIGTMREHYMQHELSLAQQSRMSLLQEDLLQCHQNTDQLVQRSEALIQAESERRREVVGELTNTNSELMGQLDALEDELNTRVTSLGQCRQTETDLRYVTTELRNEVNHQRHENAELTSRIAAMQYQTILPEDGGKLKENAKVIENLKKQADMLKIENADLKVEIVRLRFLLLHSNSESDNMDSEDDGYVSVEDVSEETSTSCSRTVESHGRVTDLKARINLLEQENADMRAEIGRLRYKSHPGNTQGKNQQEEVIDVWEDSDWFVRPHEHYADTDREEVDSTDDILQLKSELYAAKRQAENWEKLYLTLKEEESHKKCNLSLDFFTCMNLFTQKINGTINATSIKDYLNVTKLLLSVEDVKDAFVNEFQNIWKEFSGTSNEEKEKKKEEGPKNAQKKWSDSVKDILNKTQSSMSDMSKQIKDTWNQVKNLSEELWKKHEPSLSKVANKITERVKKFSNHIQNKIHRKASKWFGKHHKKNVDQKAGRPGSKQKKVPNKKHNSEKMHKKARKHHGSGNKHHKGKDEKKQWKKEKKHGWKSEKKNHKEKNHGWKSEEKHHKEKKHERKHLWKHNKNEEYLKKRVVERFQHLRKVMGQMSEAKHLTMTRDDVQDVCDFFTGFQSQWDIYKWLKFTDVQWIICQSAWWHSRLNNQIPLLGLKCQGNIYLWQLGWAPSVDGKGNFKGIRGKGYKLGQKLRKEFLERNRAAGKPYSYEQEKVSQDDQPGNETEWYEQRAKDREEYRKEWEEGREKQFNDWYQSMMNSRTEHREEEHKSDWLFERAANREEGRSKDMNIPAHPYFKDVDSNGQAEPRAQWVFARAENREYHHSQPDSWDNKRSRADVKQQGQGWDYVNKDFNDDDDDYDDAYVDDDPDCLMCDL